MRRSQIVLTGVLAALLLSACGGAGESATGGADVPMAQVDSAKAVARDVTAPESAATARPTPAQRRPANAASGVEVTQQNRQVIYKASMTVRAEDVAAAVQQAKQTVTTAGGYLAREESRSSDDARASALLEFKIPPARYNEVLATLGKDLGRQLRLEQGTEDVTLKVADVESRLKSAEQALESLRSLLKRADTIGQVLDVEREIAGREADLESLQAQQKELAAQVGMATLSLRLVGPVVVVEEPSDEPAGFLGGLKSGWNGLVSFVKVLLTVLGTVLPWLVVVVPPLALAIFLVRRRRRAGGGGTGGPGETDGSDDPAPAPPVKDAAPV
ncbi:DUF4349 domain-containing protein [Nonomuraea sp. NPDC003214]